MEWDINSAAKRMIRSLWIKFLVLLFAISLINLSAAFFLRGLIIKDFEEYLEGETEDRIYRILAAVEGSFEKYSGWNTDILIDNTLWALLLGYEIKILDINDRELMNTRQALKTISPLMKRRIMAITNYYPEGPASEGKEVTSYPMFLGGKEIGSLEARSIGRPGELVKETIFMERSNRFLLFSLLASGGISILLSLVFSMKLTNPIKNLTAAANDISEGKIKSRVPVTGRDEISNLAQTFNAMADNLEIQESLRRKLTSNIAHELRTPISAMQGEIEGMIDGLIPVNKERLLSLHEETDRLKKIIEGLEELSRAQASALEMKKQNVSIKPFLSNIKGRFEKVFADKGVSLEYACDDSMTLYADPEKLSQIVINLLSNALKSTYKGGTVWIKAGMKEKDGFIQIADTGSGINKEALPFIFERFYRIAEGGLGLGLTIVKELTEAHGGRIEVQSDLGKGSVFTVYLPNFTISS
jgi:two-component system sensor histidine kinase BaeS